MINIKNTFTLFISLTFLISAGFLNEALIKPELNIEKQKSAVNINTNFLKFFNAGYSRLISDVLWIVTLLESDHEHYKKKDLNSWMYLRFKTIITLDPLFLEGYQFGGKYLSIIKDDIYGAQEIFDKGLKQFSNDYELLFNAAFLYAFELKDNIKGYELYDKVSTYKEAPNYIKTLKYKLKFESDKNLELAFQVLSESLKKEKDLYLIEKIKKNLYAIKAEIDLTCLNSKKNNCNLLDYDGKAYIFKNNIYQTEKPFIKYGISRK